MVERFEPEMDEDDEQVYYPSFLVHHWWPSLNQLCSELQMLLAPPSPNTSVN